MTNKQLSDLIKLSVKIALKEELQVMKREIISEIRSGQNPVIDGMKVSQITKKYNNNDSNSLVENQKRFRENYQSPKPNTNRRLANDPMLNEILRSTEPVPQEEQGYMGMFETETGEEINVPTTETGRALTSAPKAVIEAMNRDYSGMFKTEEKAQKPQGQGTNSSLRNAIVSRMESISEGTDNYDDEEDFSFLDQVS